MQFIEGRNRGPGIGGAVGLRNDVSSRGVIMPEETWGDKGRYPLIKSENRGDVVYEWSLIDSMTLA